MRRWIKRNAGGVFRIGVGAVWLAIWSVLTLWGIAPKDFAVVVAVAVPTALLVAAEIRHAEGRPDISLGDPETMSPFTIVRGERISAIEIVRGVRIKVENQGAPVRVTLTMQLDPDPYPRVRVLHREGDWLRTTGQLFEERTRLAKGQTEWFGLASLVRDGGSDYRTVIHNARSYHAVELLDLNGPYRMTVTAFAGSEPINRKVFILEVDPGLGALTITPA